MKKYGYLVVSLASLFMIVCKSPSSNNLSYPKEMPPLNQFRLMEKYLNDACNVIIEHKMFVVEDIFPNGGRSVRERWSSYYTEGSKNPFEVVYDDYRQVEYWVDPNQEGAPKYYFPDRIHFAQKFPDATCSILGKPVRYRR